MANIPKREKPTHFVAEEVNRSVPGRKQTNGRDKRTRKKEEELEMNNKGRETEMRK